MANRYNREVMKQSVNKIKNFWWIPVGVLHIVGIVLGASYDLNIAKAIYAPDNLFGKIIEYVGSVPGYVLVGFVGPLLFIATRSSSKNWIKYLGFAAFFVIPLVSGLVLGYDVFYDSLHAVGFLGGMVVTMGLDALLYLAFKNADPKDALKDAFIIAISFAVTFILVFLLKKLVERPRFIYVVGDLDAFKPLFDFSSKLEGVDESLLNSFPSGHSAIAATFLLVPLLCKYNEKTKNLQGIFFITACLWLLITMLGRMSDGHHYLSDVCFGAFLGALLSFLTNFFSKFVKLEKKDETENG